MEQGICSLRELEKLCYNDIRFMYLLDGMKDPSFATLRAMAEEVMLREIVYIRRCK